MSDEEKIEGAAEEMAKEAAGEDAEFMGDAPGADIQSCVPTLKIEKKEVSTFVPPAPGRK